MLSRPSERDMFFEEVRNYSVSSVIVMIATNLSYLIYIPLIRIIESVFLFPQNPTGSFAASLSKSRKKCSKFFSPNLHVQVSKCLSEDERWVSYDFDENEYRCFGAF